MIISLVFFITNDILKQNEVGYLYKRNINNETVENFNQKLYEIDWNEVKSCQNASESYEIFLTKFLSIYNAFLSKEKHKS